jgi:hypothetical protein
MVAGIELRYIVKIHVADPLANTRYNKGVMDMSEAFLRFVKVKASLF